MNEYLDGWLLGFRLGWIDVGMNESLDKFI